MPELSAAEIAAGLHGFTGSDTQYRHWTGKIHYTEGVKWLADHAEAYWLLDAIASHQLDPKVKAEEFQVWTLQVADHKAMLTCEDGNGREVTHQRIPYTDFPLREIKLWCEFGTLMLPSER